MTEKISTLILEIDLECTICSKKIKKVLRKLRDRENIQCVVYNEKENKVTLSGPFNAKKLSKKLRCKACEVINKIEIKPDKPPEIVVKPPDVKPPDVKPPNVKPPATNTVTNPNPPNIYLCPYPIPYLYPWPTAWPFISVCGCPGLCKCKSYGESLPVVPTCAASRYNGCTTSKFICEDEPSFCSIM